MPSVLITGATGKQGNGAVHRLLEQGVIVHALTRNTDSEAAKKLKEAGVLLFEGDVGDGDAVTRAAQGTSAVFLNPPYSNAAQPAAKACEIFVEAIAALPSVTSLVLSTAAGTGKHAELFENNPKYTNSEYYAEKAQIEDIARRSGIPNVTILRPGWLMHNYLPPFAPAVFPAIVSKKLITGLKPTTKIPHLDAADVGRWAAAALLDPGKFAGKEIDLAAECLTIQETAEIVSDVAGVKVVPPTPEFEGDEARNVSTPALGYQTWANEFDATIDIQALRQEYGLELVGLREYLQQHREELKQALGC